MSIYTIRILHETGADAASKTHHQARQDALSPGMNRASPAVINRACKRKRAGRIPARKRF